jgi:intracellular sulfur oxidation DsrE/DsrF family protein
MSESGTGRRSIVAGAVAALTTFVLKPGVASAQSASGGFQAARHPQDAWLGSVPGRHRTIIDCASVRGAGEGLLFANNLFVSNKSGYQLDDRDLAIVVCLRHFATVFAYNDAMWAKYGRQFSSLMDVTDPKTRQPATINLLDAPGYGDKLPNGGIQISALVKRGVQFAVCDMATRMVTGEISRSLKVDENALHAEIVANLIPNSHLMAAGVLAVNRAQEYGYTLLTTT